MKVIILCFILQSLTSYFISVRCVEVPSIYIPGNGIIFGTYMKMFRTQNIKAYLGIRYAEALRFSPPDVDVPAWTGAFNATTFGPDCWQNPTKVWDKQTEKVLNILSGKKNLAPDASPYDENCLHLNVFVPDGPPGNNGYAVIVWIHSGDFSSGNAKDIDPFQLVFKQKVIVVTFAYRLNIFGFFSTDDGEAQGNYGLMDQSAALYWIKRNINYFGGDDKRITLMGHSAGAVSVGLHLTSGEWSKGAFHKAIIMSGNPLMENSVKTPKEYDNVLDMVSNTFGCVRRPTSMLIQCLKRVDAKIISQNLPSVEWGPIIDYGLSNTSYPFIENYPLTLLQRGKFHKVPIVLGITDMEDVLTLLSNDLNIEMSSGDFENYVNEIAETDIRKIVGNDDMCTNFDVVADAIHYAYSEKTMMNVADPKVVTKKVINLHNEKTYIGPTNLLVNVISKFEEVYLYIFNTRPKTGFFDLPSWISVPKYFDQIFVWGIPYMNRVADGIPEWNSTDKKVSDIVMTLWANFAKSSNPTKSNVYVKWSASTESNSTCLLINENFDMDILPNNYRATFWNDYYPKVLQFSVDCCNSTNTAASSNYSMLNIYNFSMYCVICNFLLMLIGLAF